MSAVVRPNRVRAFPFPRSSADRRKRDFSEVQEPYTLAESIAEADRCLTCGTPVCMDSCPVLADVRGMCEAVARGDLAAAYRKLRETNPLPVVTARCCPQLHRLCEDACAMRWAGHPIAVGMIQRFVADWERVESRQPEPPRATDTGKHVSVVGAGPAGLAAADLLRRYGHTVTIFEEGPAPGGTAWYGIPDFHLPKEVFLYEMERIQEEGVEIKLNMKVGRDVSLRDLLAGGSNAVLIATGLGEPVKEKPPGLELKGIYDGYRFLHDVFVDGVDNYLRRPKYDLGKEILVMGGGDAALDCARTALRLSSGNVTVVYRRTVNEMPADPIMIEEAKEEGVQFRFLAQSKSYNGVDGRIVSTTLSATRLGAPDEHGKPRVEVLPEQESEIRCSSVLLALGRRPNPFLQRKAGLKMGTNNSISIDDHYRTSMEGVFAAGDVTTGESLVVKAMASGREAAQRIHEYLMGLEEEHVSFYDRYYNQRTYEKLIHWQEDVGPPPP